MKEWTNGALDVLLTLLDGLPGVLAWLLELLAVTSAGGCVVLAALQAYQLRVWTGAALVAMAGLLIGLAILTSYYTRPGRTA